MSSQTDNNKNFSDEVAQLGAVYVRTPSAETIARELKSDPEFIAATKGEKGDKGDPGEGGSGGMSGLGFTVYDVHDNKVNMSKFANDWKDGIAMMYNYDTAEVYSLINSYAIKALFTYDDELIRMLLNNGKFIQGLRGALGL